MISEKTTLAELAALMGHVPGGSGFVPRITADTFDKFVVALHNDLDDIVRSMESNPERHYHCNEDGITYHVQQMLRQRFYRATQGTFSGGSVDLTVEGVRPDFVWTCEAKIFHSLPAVRQGFLQLDTRYRPANVEHAKVGMLIYIKRPRSADLMGAWKGDMAEMGLDSLQIDECVNRPRLAFHSTHVAQYSALPVSTRHMSITLYQIPEDKSGVGSAKHIEARKNAISFEQSSGS